MRNGAGYTSSVLQAIEFAVANRDRLNIDVINLSLGHPIYESPATDPLVQAVEAATRAGIVVVASAGNYGLNEETGQVGYAGLLRPATRRRRSRSARSTPTARRGATTTRWRPTVRGARRGSRDT